MNRRQIEHILLLRVTRNWTLGLLKPAKASRPQGRSRAVRALFFLGVFSASAACARAAETAKPVEPAAETKKTELPAPKEEDSMLVSGEGERDKAMKLFGKMAASNEGTPAVKEKQAPEEKEAKKEEKILSGSIVFIGKNKMSIEYGEDETGGNEILFSVDSKVRLKNAKTLSQFKQGDRVSLKYDEMYLEPKKKGDPRVVLQAVVKELTFVKSAPKALEGGEAMNA